MRLTQTLLGRLYRRISRDPLQFLALRLVCDGSDLTWQVQDDVLTTAPVGGTAQPLTIALGDYTIASLVAFLAGQQGYSVLYANTSSLAALSACTLLDAVGDTNASNGDHLYAYQSRLDAILNTVAGPLKAAHQAIFAMPAEMSTTTADGTWLDYLGGYYDVPRLIGEADAQYGPRIIAEVTLPKGNNIAIANLLTASTGQPNEVVDVIAYGPGQTFDGSITFDGAQDYDSYAPPIYGLFDVTTGFDILGATDPASFSDMIRNLVQRVRAAGTQMRALALQGSTITDTYASPTDGSGPVPVAVVATLADTLNQPADTSFEASVAISLADGYSGPSDTASLTVSYATKFSGLRHYNGQVPYNSGGAVTASL